MKTLTKIAALIFIGSFCQGQVNIQTNIPPSIAPNSTLNIEVKINKGGITNFAKYQVDVPQGVTMREGNSLTGNFSFEDGRAKVVWVSIPSEPEFIISFVMSTGNLSGTGVFNQKLYYLENGGKKDAEADPVSVTFDPAGATFAASLPPVSGAVTSAVKTDPDPATTSTAAIPETTLAQTTEPATTTPVSTSVAVNTPKSEIKTPPVTENKTPPVSSTPEKTDEPSTTASKTNSGSGMVYKVQLGAYGFDPGKARFKGAGNVIISKEDGFYKVLLGNFGTKEEALSKRAELISKGFDNFVVAYLNGRRVK